MVAQSTIVTIGLDDERTREYRRNSYKQHASVSPTERVTERRRLNDVEERMVIRIPQIKDDVIGVVRKICSVYDRVVLIEMHL